MTKYIAIPVDGATNIKLEILDLATLTTVESFITATPTIQQNGLNYNQSITEFNWFVDKINSLPAAIKQNLSIISPVARGASGALISQDNKILDSANHELTLAYTNPYPKQVEEEFEQLVNSAAEFYQETGAILAAPGSLTLLKRFIFEKLERPKLLQQAAGFATYNVLMAGFFLNKDFLTAIKQAGNEHTYWMAHTGARNINTVPGTLSSAAKKIASFRRLVPRQAVLPTKIIGQTTDNIPIAVGGHDTALSHLPIITSFRQQYPEFATKPLIHIEAGSWTMCARIGPFTGLPENGYKKGILLQGTVDGEPVITTYYGGGFDLRYLKELTEKRQKKFIYPFNPTLLTKITKAKDCFVLPNMDPKIHGTGPFPDVKGKIINAHKFFSLPAGSQHIITCLTIAFVVSQQLNAIADNPETVIILTAGGAKDPYLAKLLRCLTGKKIFIVKTTDNEILTKVTALGAGIIGKAALLKQHPHKIDLVSSNISYHSVAELPAELQENVFQYVKNLHRKIIL